MSNNDLKQPVTKEYLGEFTENVLLPGISSLIDEKLRPISDKLDAVDAKLTAHLELPDKRYLELKNREKLLSAVRNLRFNIESSERRFFCFDLI